MRPPVLSTLLFTALAPVGLCQDAVSTAPDEVATELRSSLGIAQAARRAPQDAAADRGYMGIQMSFEDGWMTITSLFDGSPAAKAGLKPGDRVRVAGKEFGSLDAMRGHLGEMKAGQKATFEVERDGWRKKVDMTLASRGDLGAELPAAVRETPAVAVPTPPRAAQQPEARVQEAIEEAEQRIAEVRRRRDRAEAQEHSAHEHEEEVEVIEESEGNTFTFRTHGGEGDEEHSSDGDHKTWTFKTKDGATGNVRIHGLPDGGDWTADGNVKVHVVKPGQGAGDTPSSGYFFEEGDAGAWVQLQEAPDQANYKKAFTKLQAQVDELRAEVKELRKMREDIRRVVELLERRGGDR